MSPESWLGTRWVLLARVIRTAFVRGCVVGRDGLWVKDAGTGHRGQGHSLGKGVAMECPSPSRSSGANREQVGVRVGVGARKGRWREGWVRTGHRPSGQLGLNPAGHSGSRVGHTPPSSHRGSRDVYPPAPSVTGRRLLPGSLIPLHFPRPLGPQEGSERASSHSSVPWKPG